MRGERWREDFLQLRFVRLRLRCSANTNGGYVASYPYTQVPGKLRQLLDKIRQIGVPPKATTQWLKTVGFKSSNDATMLSVLKFIGFADPSSGAPTSRWNRTEAAIRLIR